jgi:hypothetical protein
MGKHRRSPRLDTFNLLHFQLLGPGVPYASRGMGRTLNASENGMLLEVYAPVQEGQEILVTVGLEEDLVDLRGRVAYAKPAEGTAHQAGIEFLDMDARGRDVLARYLRAFRDASV